MFSTQALFNRRAAGWDSGHTHNPEKIRLMLALSCLSEGMDILDAGCGTGVLEPYLLSYRPRRILAVDFAEKMIEVAREKLSDPRVEFICADVLALNGIDCDCCFLYNAYPYFPDPKRLLEHLSGLVRPGGRLTISHSRGRAGASCTCPQPCGQPPNQAQALEGLMRPHFQLDAFVDNNAIFLLSAMRV